MTSHEADGGRRPTKTRKKETKAHLAEMAAPEHADEAEVVERDAPGELGGAARLAGERAELSGGPRRRTPHRRREHLRARERHLGTGPTRTSPVNKRPTVESGRLNETRTTRKKENTLRRPFSRTGRRKRTP